jgi:hypothetical protein
MFFVVARSTTHVLLDDLQFVIHQVHVGLVVAHVVQCVLVLVDDCAWCSLLRVVHISHREQVALRRGDHGVHRADLHVFLRRYDHFRLLRHDHFRLLLSACYCLLLRCEDLCLVENRVASLRHSFNHAYCPTCNALLSAKSAETFCSASFY